MVETSRLILKPIDESSILTIINCLKLSVNNLIPKNPTKYHINKFLCFNNKIKSFNSLGYFAVMLKHNLEIIGIISIIPRYINEFLVNELGYLISHKYRNNGIASEIIYGMLKFVFLNTNIDKIYSLVEENNSISKHILENKLKFDFINVILDSNTFKNVYTLDKFKFMNKVELCNVINQF